MQNLRAAFMAQVILVSLVAGLVAWYFDLGQAKAFFYGGSIALINVLLLWWRAWQANRRGPRSPHKELGTLIRSSIERLMVVVASIGVGMAVLKLSPLALVAGFAWGQLCGIFLTLTGGNK